MCRLLSRKNGDRRWHSSLLFYNRVKSIFACKFLSGITDLRYLDQRFIFAYELKFLRGCTGAARSHRFLLQTM